MNNQRKVMGALGNSAEDEQLSNLRGYLVAMSQDWRILMVKLAGKRIDANIVYDILTLPLNRSLAQYAHPFVDAR